MADIDDKAMRTVRLTTVLIGILITAVQIAPEEFHDGLLTVAIGTLVLSMLIGISTYDESNLFLGPDGTYIEELSASEFDNDPWDEDLAVTFAGMISENHDDIRWNARLLWWTLRTLILGLIVAVASIGI
jgi:hypothetical protein